MDPYENALAKFFGVVVHSQTYLNALYLLLAFPLGLFYFIFLVTGLSLGFGLLIVWIGAFILMGVVITWVALSAFERQLAIALLHEDIPPMQPRDWSGKSLWQRILLTLSSPVTWKGLVYLFARFPLGILSFVVLVTLSATSLALVTAPLYYQWVQPSMGMIWNGSSWTNFWLIDSLDKAFIACLVGLLLAVISLHAFNGLAWLYGKFARLMLGDFSPQPARPPAGPVPQPADPAISPVPPSTSIPPTSPA